MKVFLIAIFLCVIVSGCTSSLVQIEPLFKTGEKVMLRDSQFSSVGTIIAVDSCPKVTMTEVNYNYCVYTVKLNTITVSISGKLIKRAETNDD